MSVTAILMALLAALVEGSEMHWRRPVRVETGKSVCPECDQNTVCDVCGQCHYCNDIDLPC